jgi:hypothetical protein
MKVIPLLALFSSFTACGTTSPAQAPTPTATLAAAPPVDPVILERGRTLTSQFYKGETTTIWTKMSGEMKDALSTEANLQSFRQQVDGQLGAETKVIDEKTTAEGPFQVYLRTASFSKVSMPVRVQWAMTPNGEIAGFFVRPAE